MFGSNKDDTPDVYLRYNALWRATELACAIAKSSSTIKNFDADAVVGTAQHYYKFLKGETK